jgi:hypothetical protein
MSDSWSKPYFDFTLGEHVQIKEITPKIDCPFKGNKIIYLQSIPFRLEGIDFDMIVTKEIPK